MGRPFEVSIWFLKLFGDVIYVLVLFCTSVVLNARLYARTHAIDPNHVEDVVAHGGAPILNVVLDGLIMPDRVVEYKVPFK